MSIISIFGSGGYDSGQGIPGIRSDLASAQVTIANHPDVRRMLLSMKAYVEGMRSFTYYVPLCIDKSGCADTEEEQQL